MVKSATFMSNKSVQSKILYKLTPLTEKLTVETDYLPYINFNGIIRAVCTVMPNICLNLLLLGTNNHFCSD